MRFARSVCVLVLVAGVSLAFAAPRLALVKTGTTTQTNDFIGLGTPSYSLDVWFDTGGNPLSALQYYLDYVSGPAASVVFGTPAFTVLGPPPLGSGDVSAAPVAGNTLNGNLVGGGWTIWSTPSGETNAFVANMASYVINTGLLGTGTYVFTFGHRAGTDDEYLGWSGGDLYVDGFDAPGTFVLFIPEPSVSLLLLLSAGGLIMLRRRGHRRTA